MKIPTAVRDQAIILGAKLLPSGDGPHHIRLIVKQFIKEQGYDIKLIGSQMDSIMQMVHFIFDNHIKAYNQGYVKGGQDAGTPLKPAEKTTMARDAVINQLLEIQENALDSYDNQELLNEYNNIVDECKRIDRVVD